MRMHLEVTRSATPWAQHCFEGGNLITAAYIVRGPVRLQSRSSMLDIEMPGSPPIVCKSLQQQSRARSKRPRRFFASDTFSASLFWSAAAAAAAFVSVLSQ